MASKKNKKKSKGTDVPREVRRALRMSAEELAANPQAYAVLCRWERGLDGHLSIGLLNRADTILRREEAASALKKGRLRSQRPAEAVRRVHQAALMGRRDELAALTEASSGWLGDVAFEIGRLMGAGHAKALSSNKVLALYETLAERSCLLHVRRGDVYRALAYLVESHSWWIREPSSWKPTRSSADAQLADLLRHLLVEYTVPAFMDAAWTSGDAREQRWYRHLALGGSIRSAGDLPIKVSRRAVGWFHAAPAGLTPCGALRFAQVRALGGDEGQALAVAGSRLRSDFSRERFWLSVILWFLDHREVCNGEYGQVIDWVHEHRHVTPEGAEAPLQPRLSMRGRQPGRVMAEVRRWHAQLEHVGRLGDQTWSHVPGLHDWKAIEGDGNSRVEYRVVQLLSLGELAEEGRRMRHCVASYARECADGATSIWSLRRRGRREDRAQRLVTLELSGFRLVQARKRWNTAPTQEDWRLIRRWCSDRQISIDRAAEID